MDSKEGLVLFFLICLSSIQGAVANHPPGKRSSCQVVDLSPCRTKNPSPTSCLRFKSPVRSRCGCRFPTGGRTFLSVEQAQSLGDACKLTPEVLGRCFDVSRAMKAGAKFPKQNSPPSTGSLQTERMTNSPMKYPKRIYASSRRLLQTDSLCTDCGEGSIDDPRPLIPHSTKTP